jgi:PAS domain S-box-containing protein
LSDAYSPTAGNTWFIIIMKKKTPETKQAKTLRQIDEEAQRTTRQPPPGETLPGTAELAHELGVHRIELEMQNEELRESNLALSRSRRKFSDLFDFAPVGYFVLDKQGAILDVNLTGAALLGAEKQHIVGNKFPRHVAQEDQDAYFLYHRKMLEGDAVREMELRLIKKDPGASVVYSMIKGVALRERPSDDVQYRIAVMDITERKKAEEDLRESEKKYKELIEANAIILRMDCSGKITFANEFALTFFGYTLDEIIGNNVSILVPPKETISNRNLLKMVGTILENPDAFTENLNENIRKNGERVWVSWRNKGLRDSGGKIVGNLAFGQDITGVKRTEELLRQSEARFKAISEASPVGVGVVSVPDGKFLYVNSTYERKYGYPKGELLGKGTPDIYHDLKDRDHILRILKEQGSVTDYEVRFNRKDGTTFWGLASVRPIPFGGRPALLGVFVDITERKCAEEKLTKLNRTLTAIGKSSQAMMRAANEPEYLEEVCRIVVEECGYRMAWIGFAKDDDEKTVEPVVHAGFEEGYVEKATITWADDERGQGPTGTAIRTGKATMCRNMFTDPAFAPWREEAIQRGYASSIVLPLMGESKAFGAINIYSKDPDPFSDEEVSLLTELANDLAHGIITLRIRAAKAVAEETLRNERNFINAVVQTTGGLIVGLDMEGRIQLFNHACEKTTGYTFNEVKGRIFWEFLLIPEDQEPVKEVFGEIKSGTHSAEVEFENYWVTRAGERRFIKWTNSAIRNENGGVHLIIGTGIDITERKQSEESLRESEERYRLLVRYAPAGIYEVDFPSGRFTEVNDVMCNILGYTSDELLALRAFDVLDDEGKARFAARIGRAEAGDRPEEAVEYRVRTKDGRFIWALLNTTFRRKEGTFIGATVVAHDITERKRAEDEIRRRAEELKAANEELERFNRAMVDRELRLIELKKQVNELCARLGEPRKYELSFEGDDDTRTFEK